MTRVLFVTRVGEIGGGERVVLDLIRHLDRHRFEPMLVTLTPGPIVDAASELGARATALPPHRTRQVHRLVRTLFRLRRLTRDWQPDIVHVNFGSGLLFAAAAAAGRPVVWHVYDPLRRRNAFERFFVAVQRRLRAHWVVFGTVDVADDYLRTYPGITACSTVLPGVDPSVDGDGARARARYGIPADSPLVLTLTRLQPHKGVHHLIDAAPAILRARPDTRFVVCGGTLFGRSQHYPAELAERARRLDVADRVIFTGFVDDQGKGDLLDAASLLVHPADQEPFGIAVIEAMAAGKPVVVTDAAGPSHIVEHGVTGAVVPRGDVAALAGAVATALADPVLRCRQGAAGRAAVEERFSAAAMARAIEDIYGNVAPA